jgi:hypothetical protein
MAEEDGARDSVMDVVAMESAALLDWLHGATRKSHSLLLKKVSSTLARHW